MPDCAAAPSLLPLLRQDRADGAIWKRLREAADFHLLSPLPLRHPQAGFASAPATEFPGIATHHFSDDETRRIHAAAVRGAGTLNDLAICFALMALREWNTLNGALPDRGRLRILVPTNLRNRADEQLPAANRMSFAFVSRRTVDRGQLATLRQGVRNQMLATQTSRIGLDLLQALAAADNTGGVTQDLAPATSPGHRSPDEHGRPDAKISTTVSARGGSLPRGKCGVGVDHWQFITATLTHAAFGMGIYAGRIVINLRCAAEFYSRHDEQTLLTMFASKFRSFASEA